MSEENEIDSYELKDEHYDQHGATLLMDRYEDDPHDDPGFTEFFRNRKPSAGWVAESEDAAGAGLQEAKLPVEKTVDEEDGFVTELDVNSDLIGQRKLSLNDDEPLMLEKPVPGAGFKLRKSTARSRTSIIADLPTLYDHQQDQSDFLSYAAPKSGLSLEQLDALNKKAAPSAFTLDTHISLAVLAKYLTKTGQPEPDVAWTYDSLITEMADHFKKL